MAVLSEDLVEYLRHTLWQCYPETWWNVRSKLCGSVVQRLDEMYGSHSVQCCPEIWWNFRDKLYDSVVWRLGGGVRMSRTHSLISCSPILSRSQLSIIIVKDWLGICTEVGTVTGTNPNIQTIIRMSKYNIERHNMLT